MKIEIHDKENKFFMNPLTQEILIKEPVNIKLKENKIINETSEIKVSNSKIRQIFEEEEIE